MSTFQSFSQQGSGFPPPEPSGQTPISDDDVDEDRDVPNTKANGAAPSNRACEKRIHHVIGAGKVNIHVHSMDRENPNHPKLKMEAQIGSMQGNLQELLQLQRGAAANAESQRNMSPFESMYQGSRSSNIPSDPSQHSNLHHPSAPPMPRSLGPPPWGVQPHSRNVASPGPSDEDEAIDPLKSAYAAAPWANMLHLAEAARLKADHHIGGDDDQTFRPKVVSPRYDSSEETQKGSRKRQKTNNAKSDDRAAIHISLNERGHNGSPDPVDLGWCTLERGKQLFDIFFERCGCYMPCFDPIHDTWDSLRRRSPFAITTIISVAAKCEDGAGPPSDLQLRSREHAEKMAMNSLFTPVSRIEIVQGLVLLASWGETFWRPGGHAIRMAMDMALHKSLAYLVEAGMGSGKNAEQIEADRPIVAGARVWLTLYKMEYEMAFAYGRPGLFCSETTIKDARDFLRHPLALPTDARLVSSCESLMMRLPLLQPLAMAPSNAAQPFPNMDGKLRAANRAITEWYNYWDTYYARNGVPKDHFLRETLITGGAGAFLTTNSYVLHEIRSRRDVAFLSDERRQWLQEAGRKAQQLVDISLRGQQYPKSIQYANLLTHYNIVYAARFLIRMATLVPESCNLRQIGKDVEQIAIMLSNVPGFMFAHMLRGVVKKARNDQVLPPVSRAPSRLPSPAPRNQMTLTSIPEQNSWSSGLTPNHSFVPTISGAPDLSINLDSTNNDQGLSSHMDFLYAEQLFAHATEPNQPLTIDTQPATADGRMDQVFSIDTWFPFPPLDNDLSPLLVTGGDNLTSQQGPTNASEGRQSWW
uniref:Uncharacterized protein n=1 Tax=Kwoniella pini CBS 10737 TaxID=1296096 RepID=A0A1B9IDK8_9TREE|nr:uncharacterized protein I206_01015 [Kwoniella pini CBS 10737]OCF53709.1 hypothetical protein I206_01015 [Kwoniella pini CBS 10737]